MSHGTRETLLQAVRTWAKSAAGISDEEALVRYDDRPRAEKPYLTFYIISHFEKTGHDELQRRTSPLDSDIVQTRISGLRESVVQINSFGAEAIDWLEALSLSHKSEAGRATLRDHEIDVEPATPINNDTEVVADRFEVGDTQDWRIKYNVVSNWVDLSPAVSEFQFTDPSHLRDFVDQSDSEALDLTFSITV